MSTIIVTFADIIIKKMDSLFILQCICCTVTALLMAMLACSRLQQQWTMERYEVSRWTLCFSMFVLTIHYLLQMKHGIRASGDDIGAVFNILFYAPVSFLISFAIYNIECTKRERIRYLSSGIAQYAVIIILYAIGRWQTGSDHIGIFLYLMLAVFAASLIAYIIANICAILKRRRSIEQETGADLQPFDRYTFASYLLLGSSAIVITIAILHRPLLFVFGPLMLVSLFVFTTGFIGFGYNLKPIKAIICDDDNENSDNVDSMPEMTLPEDTAARISEALGIWAANGGYRDPAINIATLAKSVNVPRRELTLFFRQNLHSSFRMWLSDIRFEKAKEMLITADNYSNDAISSECGFSSHTQLYRIFKTKTGMSPGQYKETLKQD